jgi:hypothetical protein
VVQEDTREVGPVASVDLRVERVDILHLSMPIHRLEDSLTFISAVPGGTARAGRRTTRTGTGNAT